MNCTSLLTTIKKIPWPSRIRDKLLGINYRIL